MKIILVRKRHGRTRSFTLGVWARALLSACLLGLPVGLGFIAVQGGFASNENDIFSEESTNAWKDRLAEQQSDVGKIKRDATDKVAALTLRMAELQARLLRLDALGERLTTIAKLDQGEFDFSRAPALGGPEGNILGDSYRAPDFLEAIDQLSAQIEDREQQLEVLDALLAKRILQREVFIAGRPIVKGWMSSRFGRRSDPFTGRVSWHNGVDFAGKKGSDIISVAAGVVTWSADRAGYGEMVEVNHGSGFSTRYGHADKLLVKAGDVVKKGHVIALMGSSGRSTGPHVHFEVYKHGRPVDPASYIHRTLR